MTCMEAVIFSMFACNRHLNTCSVSEVFVCNVQLYIYMCVSKMFVCICTCSPFDSAEKMRPLSVSRQSVSSRKSSVYSWTAPSTPSFTEKYFIVSAHTHTHTLKLNLFPRLLPNLSHNHYMLNIKPYNPKI